MTHLIKIYYSDRLNHIFSIYPYESIDVHISIEELITEYYNKSIKNKKMSKELFNKIINDYELYINNILITIDNKKNTIKDIYDISLPQINILLQRKVIRDIEGYNIMTNLLRHILSEKDSYNIVSEFSYNVQNIDNSYDQSILEKNILQQTQYKHLPYVKKYKNINVILYDMAFFCIDDSINHEQIYNLIELDEIEIKEFEVNPNKIKKFVKPAGKNIVYNKDYKNKLIAQTYADELDKILSKYEDTQITWYIVNYKNIFEHDKISCILEQIESPKDSIRVYGFSG
jgi:hypothetical protein